MLLGFGGAIASALAMVRLRDDETRRHRGKLARRISIATWLGLVLLLVSGVMLVFEKQTGHQAWLMAKHLFVVVIIVDALLIHLRYFPRFFRQIGTADFDGTYKTMRRIGTVSVVSWIATVVLSAVGVSH